MELTQRHGFRGVSYRDLADRIGIKSAAIHYHFPKKSDLGEALALHYYDLDIAYLQKGDAYGPEARIDHFVQLFSDTLDKDLFCLFASAASDRGDVPGEMNRQAERFFEYATEWIAEAISEAKSLDKTVSIPLASEFVGLIYGVFLMSHNGRGKSFFEETVSTYRASRIGV